MVIVWQGKPRYGIVCYLVCVCVCVCVLWNLFNYKTTRILDWNEIYSVSKRTNVYREMVCVVHRVASNFTFMMGMKHVWRCKIIWYKFLSQYNNKLSTKQGLTRRCCNAMRRRNKEGERGGDRDRDIYNQVNCCLLLTFLFTFVLARFQRTEKVKD